MPPRQRKNSGDVFVGVTAFLLFILSCVVWYHFWVKPNDIRMKAIRDCMYLERTRTHREGSQTEGLDDFSLYAWCVEKVGKQDG